MEPAVLCPILQPSAEKEQTPGSLEKLNFFERLDYTFKHVWPL
jgi:hypothetical protein